MDGVTTAILLFVFTCVLFPRLIDNRPQYYAALAITLIVIVLLPLRLIFASQASVLLVVIAVLQAVAVLLLFLSAGGLTVRGLTKDMAGAFEVIRRGETEKELIIPTGNRGGGGGGPKKRPEPGEPAERVELTDSGADAYPSARNRPAAKPNRKDDDGPIPMD